MFSSRPESAPIVSPVPPRKRLAILVPFLRGIINPKGMEGRHATPPGRSRQAAATVLFSPERSGESADGGNGMSGPERNERWRGTARLSLATVVAVVILVLFFLSLVELPDEGGYPLGFVLTASGLPLAGVLLVFWFSGRQERIDRQHGVFED